MAVFRENGDQNINVIFKTTKRHIIARDRVFWCILRVDQFGPSAVGSLKNQKKKTNILGVIFHLIWREKTLGRTWTKFCSCTGDILDVTIDANFGDDRLCRFGVARGQIYAFP